jgi:hypothetical protein
VSEHKLARILWQVTKMFTTLLEKEYGLGKERTADRRVAERPEELTTE